MSFIAPIRLLLAVLVALPFFGCAEKEQEEKEGPRAVPVEMAQVETRRLQDTVQGVGTFEALESVGVAAETGGRLVGIHFTEGDVVQAGDLLFTLDDAEQRQQIAARRAALAEARSELENARRDLARRRELLPEGLVSQENVDRAATAVETARSRVERLQAELDRFQEMRDDTRIVASMPGRVGARRVDVGDYVDAGQVLVELVNTHRLKVSFTVPERAAAPAAEGQKVEVHADAFPERSFSGEVYFISPNIDPGTRSLLIKAWVENSDDLLRPGGFAAVDLVTGVRENALVIPEEALVPTRTGYMVFVVEEGRARKREVEIGLRKPGLVEITNGLSTGETVVQSGHMALTGGDPVRDVELEEKKAGSGSRS